MREVFLVSGEKRMKAEDALKKDDLTGRQSISIRMCSSLGFKDEGFFIIFDGTEESLKKARELIKEFTIEYKNKDDVLKKYDDEEERASHGFGFIMGL
ncbi:MAG: hypothetical protein HY831_02760 [Candidatus Aenigmarchaeota archaeon]|nr:hypothetical protein [Candidatus Aenigmarchaeota archaeon]